MISLTVNSIIDRSTFVNYCISLLFLKTTYVYIRVYGFKYFVIHLEFSTTTVKIEYPKKESLDPSSNGPGIRDVRLFSDLKEHVPP